MTATQRVDVARLSELLDKATPGPWQIGMGNRYEPATSVYCDDQLGSIVATCAHRYNNLVTVDREQANASLIAEAINALPALLQQLAELQGACAELTKREAAQFSDAAAWKATARAMSAGRDAAESKLAERDAEIEAVVGAKEHWRKVAEGNYLAKEAAERAREGACAIFAEVIDTVRDAATDARMNHHAKRGEYHDEMAARIAAFLAANGGG